MVKMKKNIFSVLICLFFLPTIVSAQMISQTGVGVGAGLSEQRNELKYPVVLVHGLAKSDREEELVNSWGRIPQVLRENGVKVYFGNTDGWGGIETNAELLKITIDSILENTEYEKVNIIAHSKGGIDSRYFIWRYNYGDRVASLTTISTPHHGAELADLVFSSRIIHIRSVRERLLDIARIFGDGNTDVYGLNQDLTTENMRDFNANVAMDKRVYYQSIYSVMDDPLDDPKYTISNTRIKNMSGDNDGLVSALSANWGSNIRRLQVSLSHGQIIDQGSIRFPGVEIPDIYLEIIAELAQKGF